MVADGPAVTTYVPQGDDTVSYVDDHDIDARADLGTVTGQGTDTVSDANTAILSTHDDHAVAGGNTAEILGGDGNDDPVDRRRIRTAVRRRPRHRHPRGPVRRRRRRHHHVPRTGMAPAGRRRPRRQTAKGNATLDGGFGTDRVHGSPSRDKVTVSGPGVDTVTTGPGPDTIALGVSGRHLSEAHRGPVAVPTRSPSRLRRRPVQRSTSAEDPTPSASSSTRSAFGRRRFRTSWSTPAPAWTSSTSP